MYGVVGCGDCEALWVVDLDPDSSQCPRCGRSRETDRRRRFVETDDADHARDVRSALLAARQGLDDEYPFSELADAVGAAGPLDTAILEEAGVDPESLQPASGGEADHPTDREGIVRAAVRRCDAPTETAIVRYATDRGLSADAAERTLAKLVRTGAVTVEGDTYRVVER